MKAELSMSVEQIPYGPGVPTGHQGLKRARVCVTQEEGVAHDVTFLSDRDGRFDKDTIVAALRNLASVVERRG